MSFMTKGWVAVAVASCAMQVQAATVELVADVAVTSYQKLNTAQGSFSYDNLLGSIPQHFDFTVRFDTDNPLTEETVLALNPLLRYVSSTFVVGAVGGSTSLSPVSASMLAQLPDPQKAVTPMSTVVSVAQTTPEVQPPTQPVAIFGDFVTGQAWLGDGTADNVPVSYSRGFTFNQQGAVVSSDTLHAMTGDEFVSFLQAHIGQAGFGQYKEAVNQRIAGSVSGLFMDLVSLQGDVTLRSVAVVPEPASLMLMGLGLPLLAWVRRRQQAV